METRLQQKLKICTGHDWREVTKSYVDFRLRNNKSRPQMCVFTPDDITKQRARLFIPEDAHSHELHRPDVFLEKYLNAKNNIIKSMPWVKFDLDDFNLLPSLTGVIPSAFGFSTYQIELTGDIKLRKIQSKNSSTISAHILKTLSVNAKAVVCDFITTLKASYSYKTNQFSFGESLLGPDSVTSVTFTPPNTLTGSVTPSANVKTVIHNGWEIQTQLGYQVTISNEKPDDPTASPATSTNSTLDKVLHDLKIGSEVAAGILAVGLIIFFAPEIIAAALVVAGAGAGTMIVSNA